MSYEARHYVIFSSLPSFPPSWAQILALADRKQFSDSKNYGKLC